MARFAIFGDSYVRRLNFHCRQGSYGRSWYREMVPQVCFENRSNGSIPLSTGAKRRSRRSHYNLGENDITLLSKPEEIFRRICGIVDDLYGSGVKSVFIAETLTRDDFMKCPGLTKTVFEKQRFSINKKLAKNTKKNEYHTKFACFYFNIHCAEQSPKIYERSIKNF